MSDCSNSACWCDDSVWLVGNVTVVVVWRCMNRLGKYCCKDDGGGCVIVGVTVMMCVCYPGSNGGVGVYMVTAIMVVVWCVRACCKGSSSGVVVWFV